MSTLRKVIQWISIHSLFSILTAITLCAIVVVGNRLYKQSDGLVSDPLKRGAIVDAVYGIGTVTATKSYALRPGVITSINDLYVKEGDTVHKGDKLANIDSIIHKAKFDGVVTFVPYKVGENIFTQVPVIVLTDLTNRYLVVSLEQQGALRVKPGQKAKLSFDSMRNQSFDGVIESIYSYNSNFLARIDASTLPKEILPDMTADVAIIVRELKNVLLVPTTALEEDTVWVKRPHSLVTAVKVQLGVVDGTMAEVVSGDLHEGDQILIRKRMGQ